MTDHALFSASGSDKWLNCVSALALEQGLPNTSSPEAMEGTVFHEIMQELLRDVELQPEQFLGKTYTLLNGKINYRAAECAESGDVITEIVVGQDMIEYAKDSLDIVLDMIDGAQQVYIEERVQYGEHIGIPDQFGTVDVGAVFPVEIVVIDHKYGKGIEVSAVKNTQLMLYALGLLLKLSKTDRDMIRQIRLVVNQPRLENLSEWTCTVEELLEFAKWAKRRAQEGRAVIEKYNAGQLLLENMEYNPNKKTCQWCKVRKTPQGCRGLEAVSLALIADDFVNLDNEEHTLSKLSNGVEMIKFMDNTRLYNAFKGVPLVKMWLSGIQETVHKQILSGNPVGDLKMVRGKAGKRKFRDEKQAAEIMGLIMEDDVIYEKSVISVAAAEKLMKNNKALFEKLLPLIDQGKGKLMVVTADDEREAVILETIDGDFVDFEQGEE